MTAKEPRPASHFRLVLQSSPLDTPMTGFKGSGQLIFPVIGASPEVLGFHQAPDGPEPAEQALVDRVSVKLQAFYDALPEDEQPVLDMIMSQAAAYGWSESD